MEYALKQIGFLHEVDEEADDRTFPMSKGPESEKVSLTLSWLSLKSS